MRLLVTGGAGFLGSHLVAMLADAGHSVTVLDNLSFGKRAHLAPGVGFILADVRDRLDEIFCSVGPDAVVHLAAQTSVPDSMADPVVDLDVNIRGTVHVMKAAAAAGTRKVVYISSAAVYGIPQQLPLTESAPTLPLSPYGLSKRTAEDYVRMLGAQHNVAHTILRPANIYGPRQTTEGEGAVVPAFLERFLRAQDPVIHGDGRQTRDFIYVADMARAVVQSLTRADGLTLNVSTAAVVSVRELWRDLAGLVGWDRPPVFGPVRKGDIPHSVMANEAARQHLNWEPDVPFGVGLAQTVRHALQSAVVR